MGCCVMCPERQPDEYAVFDEEKDGYITGSNDVHLCVISNTGVCDDTNEKDVITLKHVKGRTDSDSYNECILRSKNKQQNEKNSVDVADINENETDHTIDITISAIRNHKESGYESDYLDRLAPEHEEMIQRNYRFLLDNLMAKCLTPRLVQENILSPEDETEIRKGLTERASVELLLQKLVHSKPKSFETFRRVLHETNQTFIVSALDVNKQTEFPEDWKDEDKLNIEQMIEREKSYILDQLHPDKILGFFVEREIFNLESIAYMTFKSRQEKAKFVLDGVLKKLPYAFNLLLHALKQTESDQLASRLNEWVSRPRDISNLDQNSKWKHRRYLGYQNSKWKHRRYFGRESKESKLRVEIKATLCSGEDMKPLLEAENYLVKRINTEEWENVRETFFKETESVLKEATFGSLIIHIIPCSKRAYDKLVKFCQKGSLEKLLKNLLSDEKAKEHLPLGPFTIKIQLLAIGVIKEDASSEVVKFRDRLIEEFDTVVDEINPMNFKRIFVDRRLLSEDYFHQLGWSLVQSRSASAADFVQKVLELGEEAVLAFKETIEKNGPEYLLGVLKKDSTKVVDIVDNEFIATLDGQKIKSTGLDEALFHESSFHITIHDSIDLHTTHSTDSTKSLNTPGTQMNTKTEVDHKRKRTFETYGTEEIFTPMLNARETDIVGPINSNYPSRSSSGFSEDSQLSHWSEAE